MRIMERSSVLKCCFVLRADGNPCKNREGGIAGDMLAHSWNTLLTRGAIIVLFQNSIFPIIRVIRESIPFSCPMDFNKGEVFSHLAMA